MNERRNDSELLRDFVRHGSQAVFAGLVQRHLNLVYATALRKVGDAGAAEEVAQNVFAALARKAWHFAPDHSLPAWLYRTTLLEAKSWWRGELRRRRREQTAAELGTTMKTSDEQPVLRALLPLLDEALLSLREKERAALLLRFYENRPMRDVGAALGVSEDAAQKRVASAVEHIAKFFGRRGFKTATLAAIATLLEKTATSASAGTATLVANAALNNAPAISGMTAFWVRFTGLTKLQTAAVCAALGVLPVAWQWNDFRREHEAASQLATQLAVTQSEFDTLQTETTALRQTSARLEKAHAAAASAAARRADIQQKFEAWKKQLHDQLLAADFQWTDDSPFVRIPKSVLRELNVENPISPPGEVSQAARELFGMTPEEREKIESALRRQFTAMDSLAESHAYETNRSQHVHPPANALASKILVVPALGDEGKSAVNELQETLTSTLGYERWKLFQPYWDLQATPSLRTLLNLDAGEKDQEFAAWISESEGKLVATYGWATGSASNYSGGLPLETLLSGATNETMFLPNGSPSELSPEEGLGFANLPQPLNQAFLDWVRQQAETRLGSKGNP